MNEVAIVTGAGSGIGRAVALRLAESGKTVILFGRDRQALQETTDSGKGDFIIVQGDVTNEKDIAELMKTAEAAGGVNVLVNNAAVMPIAPIDTAELPDWKATVDTNLMGMLNVTHAVMQGMRARGSGHLVMISSVAGRHPFPAAAVYSATKAAMDSFSEGLRAECAAAMKHGGPSIRVTTIAPGAVSTNLTASIRDIETRSHTEAYYASMTSPLTPEDVADAVQFVIETPPHVCISDITMRPTEMVR